MSPPNEIFIATGRFESARHLDGLSKDHRCHAMHGHGFSASAFAEACSFHEMTTLQDRIDTCIKQLNYRLLNDVVHQPSDMNLARWILDYLELSTVQEVSIQSTPDQGVAVNRNNQERIWRRYHFRAAHQLPNVPQGHKCGRMHGHGFQVILQAYRGRSGSDDHLDYNDLDSLWAPLNSVLNYQCLNEIPGLANPTSEMISFWIWEKLKPQLSQLVRVNVYETSSCGAAFDGTSYSIWKEFSIDSSIQCQLAPSGDARRKLHGDTFTLRLHLSAPIDQVMGWTVDFGDVKTVFNPIFKSLDHQPLHTLPEFVSGDAISIARWVLQEAKKQLEQTVRVDVFNSLGAGAICGYDDDSPLLPG